MTCFNIQIFSDIHLEQFPMTHSFLRIEPKARFLFLVGDIGHIDSPHWSPFFEYCAVHWEKVFVVLGNHEYYSTFAKRQKSSKPPVPMIILQQRYVDYFQSFSNIVLLTPGVMEHLCDDIHVIGSTGWSRPSPESQIILNDFRYIFTTPTQKLSFTDVHALHHDEYQWIISCIQQNPEKQFIVMTHFPPIAGGVSHPDYENNEATDVATSYFRNNYTFSFPNVVAWLFGHTHFSSIQERRGCLYISNQYGNRREREHTVFRYDGLFELPMIQKNSV